MRLAEQNIVHLEESLILSSPLVPAKKAYLGYSPKMLDDFFRRPCTLSDGIRPSNASPDYLSGKHNDTFLSSELGGTICAEWR